MTARRDSSLRSNDENAARMRTSDQGNYVIGGGAFQA